MINPFEKRTHLRVTTRHPCLPSSQSPGPDLTYMLQILQGTNQERVSNFSWTVYIIREEDP